MKECLRNCAKDGVLPRVQERVSVCERVHVCPFKRERNGGEMAKRGVRYSQQWQSLQKPI